MMSRPPPADEAHEARLTEVADANPYRERTQDHDFHEIGRSVPGFAGLFLDKGPEPGVEGPPVVYLTDPGEASDAQAAVRPILEARGIPLEGFQVRAADYDWRQLAEWRRRITPATPAHDITQLGIDVKDNRITVGIEDESGRESVTDVLVEVGVPEEAVQIRVAPAVRLASVGAGPSAPAAGYGVARELGDSLGELVRPPVGGLRTNRHSASLTCSIGVIVEGATEFHLTTASHCTPSFGSVDNTNIQQPAAFGNKIAEETVDPAPFGSATEEDCPTSAARCRWADAVLAEYVLEFEPEEPTGFGQIAKGMIIDGMFLITDEVDYPLQGQIVHMVGASTGWTSGEVTETGSLRTVTHNSTTYYLLWQYAFDATSAGGDSGAPVFIRITGTGSGNKVKIAGLMWGGDEDETWFSPWGNMFSHFGFGLDVEHPNPPAPPEVTIDGPDEIEPDATCTWYADVSSGLAPFRYDWRNGTLPVSTDSSYVGGNLPGGPNPFLVYLEVKDYVGQIDVVQMYVTETESAEECLTPPS